MKPPTNNSNNFLLLLLPLLIPIGFGQLLLPSTHSPMALSSAAVSSSRRPCPCPTASSKLPQMLPIPKMKVAKVQAKAPDKGGEEKLTPLVMDESLLGALRDVGRRLAPFKTDGGKGKKKKKTTGKTTTNRLNQRHNRPKRQQKPNQIVDPALAGPEGTKCNSDRIRQIIRKAKGRDSFALKRNIQSLAERTFASRFNVVCARGDFSYISNTEEFCQDRVRGNTCYVFRQLGKELPFPEPPQLDQFERSLVGKRAPPTSQQKWRRKKA